MSLYAESYNARPKAMSWTKFIICVIGTAGVGFLCMFLSGAWRGYGSIRVSSTAPPLYSMYIVWPVLYVLMGTSLYSVVDHATYTIRSQNLKKTSIVLWTAQFMMLLLLPFLLYKFDLYMLTFVLTALITALVAALSIINLKITAPATVLLLPYLAWMVFETYLSLIIAMNNF